MSGSGGVLRAGYQGQETRLFSMGSAQAGGSELCETEAWILTIGCLDFPDSPPSLFPHSELGDCSLIPPWVV